MLDTYDLKRLAETLDKLNDLPAGVRVKNTFTIALWDERDIKIKFDQESDQYKAIV